MTHLAHTFMTCIVADAVAVLMAVIVKDLADETRDAAWIGTAATLLALVIIIISVFIIKAAAPM